ncbi:M13 family metallopeptidase [Phenylobacterium montanum]|uniref:Peptidase M13 n=1 Tax=Phenylobacterium montanum TaxID=2823693 RepID=A0A975FWW3_9CAUL|nr:M13-type metalloendopeptidase [Caulobacter sp. S6]QUD86337.1 peptidase M13 [Caulobacter sp. S6]
MKSLFLASCAVIALSAFTPAVAGDAPDAAAVATPHYGTWGYDLTGEDKAASPGADFFRFANGAWSDHAEIPADRVRFGNFDKLYVLSENRTRLIIESAAAGQSSDPDAAKIGAAYKAFMDQDKVEALDAKPLAPDLDAIRAEKTLGDVAALMGRSPLSFQGGVFAAGIQADQKAPTKYAVYLDTAGLSLPDRDYYLEAQFAEKKQAYQAYVAKMLGQIGWPDADAQAKAVVDFETEIAKVSWTKAQERDPDKTYNPMSVDELVQYAPGFDFKAFLRAGDLPDSGRVILGANTAFPKVAAIFANTPMETLKAWQAFQVVDSAAPYLSDRFVQARFEFRNKTLAGQPQQKPRWKRGVAFVQGALGESVGRLYVAQYFTPEAKAQMDDLVGQLRVALKGRIERLDWMAPETKAKALEKLSKFTVKIGYPDRWRDYSPLTVAADDLYGDAERSTAYEWERQVKRLNDPVDKMEWGMTPQTVNAYYNPTNNEIVFPAAILQPPFFDPKADPAINYGGIGAVIGHEMTHGFDDEGRKYDGLGALSDWWSPQDAKKFEAQTARLGAQYSAFEPLPGAHIKGDNTMGENIADLGGLLVALDAYHASLHGKPAPVIDGLTGDQRVFLGFAQIWREKIRDDALRQQIASNEHSPAHYRVVGTVRNVDAWYKAFGIKPGDPMYVPPEQRVRIW